MISQQNAIQLFIMAFQRVKRGQAQKPYHRMMVIIVATPLAQGYTACFFARLYSIPNRPKQGGLRPTRRVVKRTKNMVETNGV